MRRDIVAAIVGRDWEETLRNRLLLATILIPPVVLTIVPLIAGQPHPGPAAARLDRPDVAEQRPEWASLTPRELTAAFGIQQFLVFFLMMPAYIPLSIASYSIVGEKTSRSLEAVLADADPDPRAAHRQGHLGPPARPHRRLAHVRGVRPPDRVCCTDRTSSASSPTARGSRARSCSGRRSASHRSWPGSSSARGSTIRGRPSRSAASSSCPLVGIAVVQASGTVLFGATRLRDHGRRRARSSARSACASASDSSAARRSSPAGAEARRTRS